MEACKRRKGRQQQSLEMVEATSIPSSTNNETSTNNAQKNTNGQSKTIETCQSIQATTSPTQSFTVVLKQQQDSLTEGPRIASAVEDVLRPASPKKQFGSGQPKIDEKDAWDAFFISLLIQSVFLESKKPDTEKQSNNVAPPNRLTLLRFWIEYGFEKVLMFLIMLALVLIIWVSVAFSKVHFVLGAFLMTVVFLIWLMQSFVMNIGTGLHHEFLEHHYNGEDGVSSLSKSIHTRVASALRNFFKSPVKHHPLITVLIVSLIGFTVFGIFIFLAFVGKDLCITFDPVEYSTTFSRRILSDTCKSGTICFTYLTISQNISSQMIVNFQVNTNILSNATVYFGIFDPSKEFVFNVNNTSIMQAHCFKMTEIEETSRWQCYANLVNLRPSSSYYVVSSFKTSEVPYLDNVYKFRTAPAQGGMVSFVNGGDLAWSTAAFELANYIHDMGRNETTAPYFAMVGGDVSYDNGCRYCFLRYDMWFRYWITYLNVKIVYGDVQHSYTLPIGTAIGNHDGGNFKRPRSDDAFYIRYFPHTIDENAIGSTSLIVEDPQNTRPLQHVHYMSDHTFMMVLDSWVHESPESQVDYIKNYFKSNSNKLVAFKNRFVVIHEGMYSSLYVKSDITYSMRECWEEMFLKYNVTIVLENHVHSYKQTYPIRMGKVVDLNGDSSHDYTYERNLYNGKFNESVDGIIYIGDGSWGAHYYDDVLDIGNPVFRQLDVISHVYLINCFSDPKSAYVINMNAYGYVPSEGVVNKIAGSSLTVKTI